MYGSLPDRLRKYLLAAAPCDPRSKLHREILDFADEMLGTGASGENATVITGRLKTWRPKTMEEATQIALAIQYLDRFKECQQRREAVPESQAGRLDPVDDHFDLRATATLAVNATESVTILRPVGTTSDFGSDSVGQRRDALIRHLGAPLPVSQLVKAESLGLLDQRFPWFANATVEVGRRLHIAERTRAAWVRLPPLLLVGPPGIGKTRYCEALAEALGRRAFVQPMAGMSDALAIVGSYPSFQAAQPSLPVRAIMSSGTADPVVILDEIDKVGTSVTHGSPTDAMLGLTEPQTASHFRDAFLDREIDAGRMACFATANTIGTLPHPLLSRFIVVHFSGPEVHHLPQMLFLIKIDYSKEMGISADNIPKGNDLLHERLARQLRRSSDIRVLRRVWQAEIERLMLEGAK